LRVHRGWSRSRMGQPDRPTAEHNLPRSYVLVPYDLARRSRDVLSHPPTPFRPSFPGQLPRPPAGNPAVYRTPIPGENLAVDAPYVLIVDPRRQEVTADVRLDGVKAWQYAEKDAAGADIGYRMYWPGLAWDLARDRLYVADAARDHVVVVDLAKGAILRQSDLPPP